MKVTVHYWCESCQASFPVHCGVPGSIENCSVKHICPGESECSGTSEFTGADGEDVLYMCRCGTIIRDKITRMIPAMASRTHGCGMECKLA